MRKRMISILTIFSLLSALLPLTTRPAFAVEFGGSEPTVFFENFEGYDVDTYPTSFTLQYNGTGDANQKVISTTGHDGNLSKVFQLEGQTSWASEQYVPLTGPLPERIVVDAYIQPVTSSRNAEIALRNLSVGTWGTRVSSVWFESEGKIVAVKNGIDSDLSVIGSYQVGNWYRITLDHDLTKLLYDVYIDGILAASDLPMHPTVSPTALSLIAHNLTFSRAYFDNVGLYTSLPEYYSVCMIGDTFYSKFQDALNHVKDGETIKLLRSFTHVGSVNISFKDITFDLNGYTLHILNNDTSTALGVTACSVDYFGEGALNVTGKHYGVYATGSDAFVRVTNATGTSTLEQSFGVYAFDGASVVVEKDATGNFRGVFSTLNGSHVQVKGTASSTGVSGAAAFAREGGYIEVNEALSTGDNSLGVWAYNNGHILVNKDTTGVSYGAYAYMNQSSITVNGNAISTSGIGAYASAQSTITVKGNAQGSICGAAASESDTSIRIEGDAIGLGLLAPGLIVDQGAQAILEGGILAEKYVRVGAKDLLENENTLPTTKTGYKTYTDGASVVWIKDQTVNQPPVVASDWNYTDVYFDHHYPFTLTVTDPENTPGTRVYSYIDNATPNIIRGFVGAPEPLQITLSPIASLLEPGPHTLNFYAVDASGATSNLLTLPFNLMTNPAKNATLTSLTVSDVTLTPVFDSGTTNYSASVNNALSKVTVTTTPSNSLAVVNINGDNTLSKEIDLNVGTNEITISVTSEDQTVTKSYSLTITRASASSGGSQAYVPVIQVTTDIKEGTTTNTLEISGTIFNTISRVEITSLMMDALLIKAIETGGTDRDDLLKFVTQVPSNIKELEVIISQTDLSRIANQTNASVSISSNLATITFDGKAIETISNAGSGGRVTITVREVDVNTLSEKDKAKVQDRPIYDFSVFNSGIQVTHFGGGKAEITLPYTLQSGEKPESVVVFYLTDDGTLKSVRGRFDAELNAVTFTTPHFSAFVIGYNAVSFNDVPEISELNKAVSFIAARGITSGTSEKTFSPDLKLTRAQFVVLMMKAYGFDLQRPENTHLLMNFSDAGNTYYTEALLTAKALGVISGVGDNRFEPDREVSKQEMLVMLYNLLRYLDALPEATQNHDLSVFKDADQIAPWAKNILSYWVKTITLKDLLAQTSPLAGVMRSEMAEVLYQLLTN